MRWIKYSAVIGAEITLRTSGSPLDEAKNSALQVTEAGEIDRASSIDALIAGLPRSALPMLDAIEVAVGYPYANHMILPWQDEILIPADRLAYAESMLEQQYGIVRSDWYCEIFQERFACPAIASAIRRDVVDEIVSACKKQKLRLRRVHSLLADTINRQSGAPDADAVFVSHQSGGYEFAFRRDGIWCNAFALRGIGQTAEQCLISASMMANHFPTNIHFSEYAIPHDDVTATEIATATDADAALENNHAPV
ncbi:hypothetical protein C7W93_02680 [Glaciimonas sp. PCH181]|nr:hypothetical protein C7W93_02680 [Glaciimonas sp. PCH181]